MASGDVVAGRDLWDQMTVREPNDFVPRLPVSERLLLDHYQRWIALQVPSNVPSVSSPAVTVAADSLVCGGRGLLTVATHLEGEFCFFLLLGGLSRLVFVVCYRAVLP